MLYGRRSPPIQGNLVDDLLMPTEVMALLGVTTLHQSFWPPLELFQDSQHFNGKWSPANKEALRTKSSLIGMREKSGLETYPLSLLKNSGRLIFDIAKQKTSQHWQ